MTQKERMVCGELYLASDPELCREREKNQKLLRKFNKLLPAQREKRYQFIKKIFFSTGKCCSVYPPFFCDYGKNICVGDFFAANVRCLILDVAKVTIGNHVMLGPGVSLLTAGHPENYILRNAGYGYGKPITIEDNVWIGANVTVNPGVRIGANTIIGSGSVVTHDIPSNVIAAGNPCKIIRNISSDDKCQIEEGRFNDDIDS